MSMPSASISLADPVRVPERGDPGVGEEHRARDAEALQLPAGVGEAPAPNLIGVASIVKIVSWLGAMVCSSVPGSIPSGSWLPAMPELTALVDAVGARHVLSDPEVRAGYESD